jgi:CRISPR-associated exonuclease Cas4
VSIHNFRSIRQCSFQLGSCVTLLGPNNHGKSNLLSALEFALSTGLKPTEEMFYALRETDDPMWVEVTFKELTDQERTTFNKYCQSDGSLCIRKTALSS